MKTKKIKKEKKPGRCTRCNRSLKAIYVVAGLPYGPICVKKLGYTEEQIDRIITDEQEKQKFIKEQMTDNKPKPISVNNLNKWFD